MSRDTTYIDTLPRRERGDAVETPAMPAGRLGLPLLVIATAQLMLVLDDTIANIALPSIQRELAVPTSTLPWIINAYLLAFGGLLLFGGRVGDLYGRRRAVVAAEVGLLEPAPEGGFTNAAGSGGLGDGRAGGQGEDRLLLLPSELVAVAFHLASPAFTR